MSVQTQAAQGTRVFLILLLDYTRLFGSADLVT